MAVAGVVGVAISPNNQNPILNRKRGLSTQSLTVLTKMQQLFAPRVPRKDVPSYAKALMFSSET